MAAATGCKKPEEHHLHLCHLRTRLPRAELDKLRKRQRYVCDICGGRVEYGRHLCAPRRIKT